MSAAVTIHRLRVALSITRTYSGLTETAQLPFFLYNCAIPVTATKDGTGIARSLFSHCPPPASRDQIERTGRVSKTAEQDIGDFSDFGQRTAEIERPAPGPARGHDPRRAFGTFVRHGKGCLSKISGKNAGCTFHGCDKVLAKERYSRYRH